LLLQIVFDTHSWSTDNDTGIALGGSMGSYRSAVRIWPKSSDVKAQRTVDMCDVDLAWRNPLRTKRLKAVKHAHIGEVVHGFHFVCPTEKGLTRNSDGTIWTGTWVVDRDHAERAVKIGGYVVLHVAKSHRRTCNVS
jgi:hypothetical protein